MNRRTFLASCALIAPQLSVPRFWWKGGPQAGPRLPNQDAPAIGQPVNLAQFGELKSWMSPEATLLPAQFWGEQPKTLNLAEVPWKGEEFDLGVEWPEYRTINKIAVRFAGASRDKCFLERWDGLSPLQGSWKAAEVVEPYERGGNSFEGSIWTLSFPTVRTCKVRLRLVDQKQGSIDGFEVFGPSIWKRGEIRIEWGHSDTEKSYDGNLEIYNGQVLGIRGLENTKLNGPSGWISTAGKGKLGGLTVAVMYTSGMNADRTILTLRNMAGDVSFLPREAIEILPIDIPDFGVYISNTTVPQTRETYRQRNANRSRVVDAVATHPEQTLENAYEHIDGNRVVAFVGVDSNSQKFGIAPAGHVTVGYGDPSFGRAFMEKFVVNFDTTVEPLFSQGLTSRQKDIFKEARDKQQELSAGWLPIVITKWGDKSDVAFERTDYAVLANAPSSLDQSKLTGNEPALLISRLVIRNDSPSSKKIEDYIKPWKKGEKEFGYASMPKDAQNPWDTALSEDCVMVTDGAAMYAICYVDMRGRGLLSPETSLGAARYSIELGPSQEHAIYTVIPGRPFVAEEVPKLKNLDYDHLYNSTIKYWKERLSEGMQLELPDPHLQNLYNANQHHFLVALTKDPTRGEYYPNSADLVYGPDPFDSSPIIQALDLRGLHKLADRCLQAYLSTQGMARPDGNYSSKQGGFYEYWPQYTSDQGFVLWALAEHYLYTRDKDWLTRVAPQIVAGCDFIIQARQQTMITRPNGQKPLTYGLAPAGTLGDPRSWQYSFMLNGLFYLGMSKCARVLEDVDAENARRIAADAQDYLQAIQRALREIIAVSPVTRLRDNTSVPCVPPFVTLRGYASDINGSVDPDSRFEYASDVTAGAFQLVKCEIAKASGPEATWLLNTFEDRFFMYSPNQQERVRLENISNDWFNLGGFDKLEPYVLYYPEAYLLRDQIPNFLRAFYNTLASIADPQNLAFQEELDGNGGQAQKTGEEAKFLMQLRQMLLIEIDDNLHLALGTPRSWLENGKQIAVDRAPSYFGEVAYRIKSFVSEGRIEAVVSPPVRNRPKNLYLRFRHPNRSSIKRIIINDRPWHDFDGAKEWIKLPVGPARLSVAAYY
jgi:hypothetical protein